MQVLFAFFRMIALSEASMIIARQYPCNFYFHADSRHWDYFANFQIRLFILEKLFNSIFLITNEGWSNRNNLKSNNIRAKNMP